MMYTVTLNPAVDFIITGADLIPGTVNRAEKGRFTYGGKGINQAAVLRRLDVAVCALGLAGGWAGQKLLDLLQAECIPHRFFRIAEDTRVNIKLRGTNDTEINLPGPAVSRRELDDFVSGLPDLYPGDILSLAGSLPPGVDPSFYGEILAKIPAGVFTVLDTSGPPLKNALAFSPYLIKPNADEAADITGIDPAVPDFSEKAARTLQKMGARNVLLSLGAHGAVLADETGGFYTQAAPTIAVKGTTGAGDSLLAGFLAAKGGGYANKNALTFAVAAGSAAAGTGTLAGKEETKKLYDILQNER